MYESAGSERSDSISARATDNIARFIASSPYLFWILIGAIALASLSMRQEGASADVSWLTSMCKRILDGEIAYIDIFETTPPIPTLLYMPGVILGRLFGVNAELAVFTVAYGAALGSFWLTARLLPERLAGSGPARWTIILPASIFLFVIADGAFAQREYFAAVFSLPIFAVFVRHAQEGSWPTISGRIFAATLAGLAFAIKPPIFALPFLLLAAYETARTRSIAFLLPSMLPVAAIMGVLFTTVSLAAFPAYLDGVTTLMRDVYVPIRARPIYMVTNAFIGTVFCLTISFILSLRTKPQAAATLAQVFAVGFLIAHLIQGKFFPYHIQPAALFALISLAILFRQTVASLNSRPAANPMALGLYGATAFTALLFLSAGFESRTSPMRDLSWAEGLNRPTALAISPDISIGFPLAEHINARWIDRIHSQWVAHYTRLALDRGGLTEEEQERYRGYYERDLERTRRLIREKAPDLIIEADYEAAKWLPEALLAEDPALFDDYEVIAEESVIRVLRRRQAAAEPAR